jgi:hypothetical protein
VCYFPNAHRRYLHGYAGLPRKSTNLVQLGRSSSAARPPPCGRARNPGNSEHVLTMQARRRRLDTAIEEMAAACEFTPVVRRMCCLHGVVTLTGFGLAVEIGDWNRFTGNTIGSFVGLVPSEYSSSSSRVQGGDHQDRQHPCASIARGSCLAPPTAILRRGGDAVAVGTGPGSGPCPRR